MPHLPPSEPACRRLSSAAWTWLRRLVPRALAVLRPASAVIAAVRPAAAALLLTLLLLTALPGRLAAAPGLCVGPVCGDEFSRSAAYHWQLRLRVSDQQGHRERLVVDCRSGSLSPQRGLVERGYAAAVARRACRLAGEGPA